MQLFEESRINSHMPSKNWNPSRYEHEIQKFVKKDSKKFPSKNAILFTGSSTIRMWKSLAKDMSPLLVINRGFGGSWIPDALHFFDKIIVPYEPKAIVFYSGENDIAGASNSEISPSKIARDDFEVFCEKIHEEFSGIPIFYIAIKPPKRRVAFQKEMYRANELIREFCKTQSEIFFIDIVPILSEGGKIKEKISKKDGIHLNKKGYKLITSVIKPILLEHFK